MRLRCLLVSQADGEQPQPLLDALSVVSEPWTPALSPAPASATVTVLARGRSGELRWHVVSVDASHVLSVCRGRFTVSAGAMAEPAALQARDFKQALQGLTAQQNKRRRADPIDVAMELGVPPAAQQDDPRTPVRPERRVAADGVAYTQAEFEEYFGGTVEWDGAAPASDGAHGDDARSQSGAQSGVAPPSAHVAEIARLSARASELRRSLGKHPCSRLPSLAEACRAECQRQWLRARMAELDAAAASADRVLSVRPDATKRLQILMQLNYLDEGQQLTLKGRVACELSTAADELLLSEAVCTGVLHSLSATELAGLLSLFVSKGKPPSKLKLSPALLAAREALLELAQRTSALQAEAGLLDGLSAKEHVKVVLNDAMAEAMCKWTEGVDFAQLRQHTMLLEGDIVRIISRVEELAKEVRVAARLLGDAHLGRKMEIVLAAIRRDVVATPSLYTGE
jgi:hypothetical protein